MKGFLINLVFKTDPFEDFYRFFSTFAFFHSRKNEGHFDVTHRVKVRNKVIRLENEPYAFVAVVVPVGSGEFGGRNAAYDDFAGIANVETADNVKQSGFSATARSENGNELVFAERKTDSLENVHDVGFAQVVVFL